MAMATIGMKPVTRYRMKKYVADSLKVWLCGGASGVGLVGGASVVG